MVDAGTLAMRLWLTTGACMLASYLICGIPFGKILGRAIGHVDIQKSGSGNIGTTNALRVAGPKVAALTLLFDVLKGVVCIAVSRWAISVIGFGMAPDLFGIWWLDHTAPGAHGDVNLALVALACLCGHVFSPYLHFHGGKGIATGVGILFGLFWPQALLHLGIFIVIVAATRYVSLGSIVTVLALPFTTMWLFPTASVGYKLIMTLLALIVVWAHRSNIKKLATHTESKLSFGKGSGKQGKGGRS